MSAKTAPRKMDETLKQQALNHLQILASGMSPAGGFLEFRTFGEKGSKEDREGRSLFIPVDSDTDQLEAAARYLQMENDKGRGVFVGVNPRSTDSDGSKKGIDKVTTAFIDLDLKNSVFTKDEAIEIVKERSPIEPDLITDSGGGLHVLYFMQPTDDKTTWTDLQTELYEKFKDLGADKSVVTDTSRVLRVTPFKNWKYDSENGGRQTGVVNFVARDNRPSVAAFGQLFDVKPRSRKDKFNLPGQIVEGGSEGGEGRNNLLFREAAALRNRGYQPNELIAALSEINRQRCQPPLPEEEVERIAESAGRYTPTQILGTSTDYDKDRFGWNMGEFLSAEFPPLEWVIYGLNNGEIGYINAIPNAGKTTLMLGIAMSASAGREYHPLYTGGRPLRVMYLDFENRKGFLQKDMAVMMQNFNEDEQALIRQNLFVAVDQEIYGVEMNLSNQEHLALLEKTALDHQANLIIIDTMAAAFTFANENDNSEAEKLVIKPLKHVARQTGAALVVVHHIGKAGETGDRSKLYSGRGASAFAAAARSIYNLEALKDGTGKRVDNHVVLSCAKIKGKPFDDIVFELDFGRRWFEPADIVLPDETSRQEQIWAVIDRPMKRKEIKEALADLGQDVSDSTLSRAIKLGIKTGKLKQGVTTGTYMPVPKEEGQSEVLSESPFETDFTITEDDVIG
jgi:hypothetical protein